MNNFTLKRTLLIVGLAIIPFFLTGCIGRDNNATVGNGKQTLTIWRQPVNKKSEDKDFEAMIAAFEKEYPNVNVEYRSFEAADQYETEVLNALATENRPDIWEIRNDELARHIDKLSPLPGNQLLDKKELNKRYASSISEEMVHEGKFYGMPLGIDPLVLYINQDHLSEAQIREIPDTWDEVVQTAVTLTRKADDIIFRPGLALGTASNIDRSGQILELLMLQLNTQMVDPSHRTATFNLYNQRAGGTEFDYPGRDALSFYASFADPTSGIQTWDATQPYSTEAFTSGNLSMMINYLSVGKQIKEINPKLNFTIGKVPQRLVRRFPYGDIPGGVDDPIYTARYRALVVSKPWERLTPAQQQERQRLAWAFINFASSGENIQKYSQNNWLLSPFLPSTSDSSATSLLGTSSTQNQASMRSYLQTWYRGKSPRTVDRVFNDLVGAVTEGGAPIPQTLDQAAQIITSLLQ